MKRQVIQLDEKEALRTKEGYFIIQFKGEPRNVKNSTIECKAPDDDVDYFEGTVGVEKTYRL